MGARVASIAVFGLLLLACGARVRDADRDHRPHREDTARARPDAGSTDGGIDAPEDSGSDAATWDASHADASIDVPADAGGDAATDAGSDEAGADVGNDALPLEHYPGPCTTSYDDGADGTPNRLLKYEYDALGREVRSWDDHEADGSFEWRTSTEYNAAGQIARVEYSTPPSGELFGFQEHTFTASGKPLHDVDFRDDEGSSTRDYFYDDGDFLIALLEDERAKGGSLLRTRYENDAHGCAVTEDLDYSDDGSVEYHRKYVVDDQCHQLESWFDEDGDGTFEWLTVQTYDDEGRLLARRSTHGDEALTEESYEYEGDRLVRHEYNDVEKSQRLVATNMYDDSGNLVLQTADGYGIVRTWRYEVDARGNTLRQIHDGGGDGAPDDITTMTYDCWR